MEAKRYLKEEFESDPNWDLMWTQFHEVFGRNPGRAYRYSRIAEELGRIISLQINEVVDFGCGTGELISFLGGKFPDLRFLGLDTSKSAVQIARSNFPRYQFELMSQSGDSSFQVSEKRFDVVVCSEVLEHLDEPEKALMLISQLLLENGRLIVSVPAGPKSFFDRLIGHKRHYTRDSLFKLLKESGFSDITISRSGFPGVTFIKVASFLRGKWILKDLEKSKGKSKTLDFSFKLMELLLQYSLEDSRLGWQLIANCRR